MNRCVELEPRRDAPAASLCPGGGVEHHLREASMGEVSTIGMELAKSVF